MTTFGGGYGQGCYSYGYQNSVLKDSVENLKKFGFNVEHDEKEETIKISNEFLQYNFSKRNILDIKWPDATYSMVKYFGEENSKKYFWFIMDVIAAIKDKPRPPRIYVSDNIKAFEDKCIGPKVLDKFSFFNEVYDASTKFQWGSPKKKSYGEAFLILGEYASKNVLSGFGKRTQDINDYILRSHKNRVEAFLKREKAEAHHGVVVCVTDRQKKKEAEGNTEQAAAPPFLEFEITDIITLAGPSVILSEKDFVKDIVDGKYSEFAIKDFIEYSRKVFSHNENWCLVAD